MVRALVLTTAAILALAAPLSAQAPQFQWKKDEVLRYRVAQLTTATELVTDKTQETKTRLDLIKRWKVLDVDAGGIATLAMSVERLRMETKNPGGETLFFDSAEPAKSNPALRDEMMKYVNTPVITVRLNPRGQLIEVKESKFGPPSRLEADLPFKIVLPGTALTAGQGWERKFAIRLEAAQGQEAVTYDGMQVLTCKSVTGNTAIIGVTHTVTNPPESPADQIPLLPMQPTGEVTFDTAAGRIVSVKYQFARELRGHNGEGSKYTFASSYAEELMK